MADNYDLNQSIGDTFPDLIAVLVVAMFLLLFLLSGSIFVPIKALITAALSIVSSFGFIVLIFQEGPANAEKLLNFKAAGILDPLQLLFIFGVSFGLSLDYEGYSLIRWSLDNTVNFSDLLVFMLVRIQEIYERTGDHVYSVCAGIELTARVVTSAAILLCIVLAAFLSSKILLLKYIGAVKISCSHFCFPSFAHI